jgi:hypothetical protein
MGWLFSSRPYRLRKAVFDPPTFLGPTGIMGRCCRVGERFLFRCVFFRFAFVPSGQTYAIFSVVLVNGVVHVWVGQKLLNCIILKSFFYRPSLANFHVST